MHFDVRCCTLLSHVLFGRCPWHRQWHCQAMEQWVQGAMCDGGWRTVVSRGLSTLCDSVSAATAGDHSVVTWLNPGYHPDHR